MGLIKKKEYGTGVTAEYWIAKSCCEPHNNHCRVSVIPYLNQAARTAGKSPLPGQIDCGVIAGKYPTGAEVYAHVKAHITGYDEQGKIEKWFSDAEDSI